eukprot:g5644.t1
MVVSNCKPTGAVAGGEAIVVSSVGCTSIRGKRDGESAARRASSAASSSCACSVTPPLTLPSRGWGDRDSGSEGCGARHFSGFSCHSHASAGDTGSTTGSCSSSGDSSCGHSSIGGDSGGCGGSGGNGGIYSGGRSGSGGRCGGGTGIGVDGRELSGGSASCSSRTKRLAKVSRRLFIEIENKASEPPPPPPRHRAPAERGRVASRRQRGISAGGATARGLEPVARRTRWARSGVHGDAGDERGDSSDEAMCGCAERCLRMMDAWFQTFAGGTARVKFSELDQGVSPSIPTLARRAAPPAFACPVRSILHTQPPMSFGG